jgi:hypothetical protein|eukprot:COSAG01_NODE_1020_length_12097_cov_3.014919_10_plen_49_part_00
MLLLLLTMGVVLPTPALSNPNGLAHTPPLGWRSCEYAGRQCWYPLTAD